MTFKRAARIGVRIGWGLAIAGGWSLTASLDACQLEPLPPEPPPSAALAVDGPRFFARTTDGREQPLALRRLAAEVGPGVRSHLTMEVVGPPTLEKAEAVVRLAIPRGAALTGAVLWVDGHPQNGAFVERSAPGEIYRSIVARRAVGTGDLDGPGFVAISIFRSGGPGRAASSWSGSSRRPSPTATSSTGRRR